MYRPPKQRTSDVRFWGPPSLVPSRPKEDAPPLTSCLKYECAGAKPIWFDAPFYYKSLPPGERSRDMPALRKCSCVGLAPVMRRCRCGELFNIYDCYCERTRAYQEKMAVEMKEHWRKEELKRASKPPSPPRPFRLSTRWGNGEPMEAPRSERPW